MNTSLEIFFVYTLCKTFIIYWLTTGFWYLCDIYIDPKYRVEGLIDWTLYKKSAIQSVIMQLTITPIILYYMIPLWEWRGLDISYDNFITIESLVKLLICPLISEVVFFYTHKLGHTPYLYKKIHRIHHEWIIPCAVSASYSHPLEYIFCNLSSFIIPPFIMNLNGYAMQLWFILASITVINSHSGYRCLNDSIRHTDHHKYNNRNFGPLKILDTLHGTEIPIKKYGF